MTWLLLLAGCGDFTRDTADTDTTCTDPVSCPLTVRDLVAECGDSDGTTAVLAAESPGPGTVTVTHTDFREGCCPSFSATATASRGEHRIAVSYALTDDSCDCVCQLDLSYTLSDVQTGEWTLAAGFDVVLVTVE